MKSSALDETGRTNSTDESKTLLVFSKSGVAEHRLRDAKLDSRPGCRVGLVLPADGTALVLTVPSDESRLLCSLVCSDNVLLVFVCPVFVAPDIESCPFFFSFVL